MGKFKKFTHAFVVHCLVLSLTIWSLPPRVHAQEIDENSVGGAIIGATKMIGGQMMNMKMQNAALMQQAAVMQQMQPKLVPARFFPQCQVPQAFNAPPEGVCEQVQSPMHLGAIQGYQQLAHKYDDLYTRMSSPAQNTPFPQGLQCIEESAKRADADMQDKLNALTAFQNKIRKQLQLFRDENKKILDDMDGINQELNGGRGGSLDAKKSDLAASFSRDCQNIMGGPAALNQLAKGKGLLGLQSKMDQSVRGPANDFMANQAIYKKDIDQLVSKMVKKMNSDGIDNFDLTAKDIRGLNGDMVKRVSETFQGEVASLKKYRDQIASDIQKTGIDFDMPRFDKNFKVDFEEFRAGAKNFYQKKYVHNCVTGADSTSLGLSAEAILGGLQQRGIRGSGAGNAVSKYREALQNILNQDNMIEDKLAQIKALDSQYSGRGEITITYQDGMAKTKTSTPYELYMETVKNCQEQFSQDNTFSTSSQGVSMKKKVERVQKYLDSLKKKHDAFVADAASSISDSLINCNGAKLQSGPGQCSGDMMSPKSNKFCMAHAQQCAGQVNKCYNDLQAKVEQKTRVLESKAKQFNANVGTLVAQQEAILKEVQGQVMATAEGIKRFFPGANYTFPKDLFVQMPPMMGKNDPGNKFGVDLIAGGDLSKNLEHLPEKIELLKGQLAEQKGKIQGVIKDYADKQKAAIGQNQSKWKAFAAKCKATEKAFRQQVAAADAQKQKDAAQAKQDVKNFCDKYKRLKNLSPAAGCGKVEDLYEESNKIAAHINGDVKGSLDAYTNVCEGRKTEEADDDKTPKIAKMCDRKSWGEIEAQTLANLMAKLPDDISKYKDKIKTYVTTGKPAKLSEISKDLADHDFADYIQNAKELHQLGPQGQNPATQLSRLAKSMENTISADEDAKKKFGGMIKNFGDSTRKSDAQRRIDEIIAGVKSSKGSSTSGNQADIAILSPIIDGFNDDANPTSIDVDKLSFKPSGIDGDISAYNAALAKLKNEDMKAMNAAEIEIDSKKIKGSDLIDSTTGVLLSDEDLKKKLKDNYGMDDAAAAAALPKIAQSPAVISYKGNRDEFDTKRKTLLDKLVAHRKGLDQSPLGQLLAEADAAKKVVDDKDFPEDLTQRAPASSGNADICANIDDEIRQVAEDTCSDTTSGQRKCISDEMAKLELNSDNGMNSKLTVTARANSILTALDQGRGIASAQDWSNIGENASDSCESMAANGRNFMGIDLSQFDLSTGAMPLGGVGAAQ